MVKKIVFGGTSIKSVKTNIGMAALRVFAGFTMAFAHGFGKIPPSGPFSQGVAQMGFPMPEFFAWMAALAEFGGGMLLAIGLATRPAAAMVAFTMVVAAFLVHGADPFAKKEMALLYLFISFFYFMAGSGRYSIDAMIRKK